MGWNSLLLSLLPQNCQSESFSALVSAWERGKSHWVPDLGSRKDAHTLMFSPKIQWPWRIVMVTKFWFSHLSDLFRRIEFLRFLRTCRLTCCVTIWPSAIYSWWTIPWETQKRTNIAFFTDGSLMVSLGTVRLGCSAGNLAFWSLDHRNRTAFIAHDDTIKKCWIFFHASQNFRETSFLLILIRKLWNKLQLHLCWMALTFLSFFSGSLIAKGQYYCRMLGKRVQSKRFIPPITTHVQTCSVGGKGFTHMARCHHWSEQSGTQWCSP